MEKSLTDAGAKIHRLNAPYQAEAIVVNLHRHMIEEAEPSNWVFQERVCSLLQAPPPLGHPVVPHVLRLEVLVDGEEDWVVGGGHPIP